MSLFVLLIVFFKILCLAGEEPQSCQGYYYQAEILERIVKAEISWDKTQKVVEMATQETTEVLRKFENDIKMVRSEFASLEGNFEKLKKNLTQEPPPRPDSMRSFCLSDAECTDVTNSECKWLTCKCQPGLSYHQRTKQCLPDCGMFGYGKTFQEWRDGGLAGYNNKDYKPVSLEECLRKCTEEKRFTCRSVDYYINGDKLCRLSFETLYTRPAAKTDSKDFNHYQRDCQ